MKNVNQLFTLKGKVSIITGAARGNGREIAMSFAKYGSNLILIDKLKSELNELKNKLIKFKIKSKIFICDLSSSNDVKTIVNKLKKQKVKIDVLINNAGITLPSLKPVYPEILWEKTYKVNLKAPFLLCNGLLKNFNKNSSIINITSMGAELGFFNNVAYQAFKGALRQMTKSMAMDYAKYNIRVNNLSPGYIKTNMTKLSFQNKNKKKKLMNRTIIGRLGNPKDLVGAAIFLASSASSYITAQDIRVDGGFTAKGDI